jgi:predicted transcriptional regulator
MTAITFRADGRFAKRLTRLAEHLGISRSAVIRKAVGHFERAVEREEWAERIREASLKTRAESIRTCMDFNAANADGL